MTSLRSVMIVGAALALVSVAACNPKTNTADNSAAAAASDANAAMAASNTAANDAMAASNAAANAAATAPMSSNAAQ
jgi:hypothetical protein